MVNRQLFSFDLNDPFFKHSVGFDRLFNQLDVINNAHHLESTYPPYNIIKTGEETFSIELAVAGFTKEEIDVEVKQETFVHKGIGTRKFQRSFTLADYVEVIEGDIVNGILVLKFERKVPEAMKPRKIELGLKEQSPKEKLAELLTE